MRPSDVTKTSSSGFLTGSERNSSVLITLKTAVLAPIPSASVSTATIVNPGFFSNWRKANLRSFITQRFHRVDLCRPASRQPARRDGYKHQQQRNTKDRQWISRSDAKKKTREEPRCRERTCDSDGGAGQREFDSLPNHERKDVALLCTESDAHTDLTRALHNGEGQHTVKSETREHERENAEEAAELRDDSFLVHGCVHHVVHLFHAAHASCSEHFAHYVLETRHRCSGT